MATMTRETMIKEALVKNLLLLYPKGPPCGESLTRTWLKEILLYEAENNDTMTDNDVMIAEAEKFYQRIMEKALEEWTSKCTTTEDNKESNNTNNDNVPKKKPKPKAKSISLFAQMDSGLLLGAQKRNFITLEDLKSAKTLEQRLGLLQKVDHVDDITLDWEEIVTMLQDGLAGTKEGYSMSMQYCNLHRKWFDQARSSTEQFPIRCDLCQNILTAIHKLTTTDTYWEDESMWILRKNDNEKFTKTHEALFCLWQLWYDMWFDILQETIGYDEDKGLLYNMGYQVLILMRTMELPSSLSLSALSSTSSSFSSSSSTIIFPAHFLSLVDPSATWFRAWTARMTPSELLKILRSSGILPDLWQRSTSTNNETIFRLDECKTQSQLLCSALKQHSLSVLRSILVVTRVQWFPASCINEKQNLLSFESLKEKFEAIANPANNVFLNGTNEMEELLVADALSSEQVEELFLLFFHLGTKSKAAEPLAEICGEAIEALIFGSRSKYEYLCQRMVIQCREKASQTLTDSGGFILAISEIAKSFD